jgi:glycosyltransferase involved in cell wall biosynthesis
MRGKLTFTVFTPTFNRAHLLGRAFQSLKEQTFRDFEWVIVDDGSTDETRDMVSHWIKEANFPIAYIWQPNSGKHVAINRGVELANGKFFVILDSDDWLVPTALERLLYWWESIPLQLREKYTGVAGLCSHPSGEIVGSPFPAPVIDSNAIEIRTKYRVKGDKFGMNRTDVLKEFPFPENLGKFVTESLVWNRIARKYITRFVNEVFAYKEYQPEGLSARSVEIRAKSNLAARTYYREFVELEGFCIPFWDRLRACVNYVRFSLHGRVPLKEQYVGINKKGLFLLSLPIGLMVYLRDKRYLLQRLYTGEMK